MPGKIARIKIALKHSKPPIWRRVEVPLQTDLQQLHFIIQDAMPWSCTHLYDFAIGGERYGDPDDEFLDDISDAKSLKLADLAVGHLKRFVYTYDFGDWWQHQIDIESVEDAESGAKYPRLVGGKRKAPPDDIGGVGGYGHFLEAMSDPKHPEHEQYMEWHGEEFDPKEFDMEDLQDRIDAGFAKSFANTFSDL